MINSLPPSVLPATNPIIAPNEQPVGERSSEQSSSMRIEKTYTDRSQEARTHEGRHVHRGHHDHDGHDRGKVRESEGSDLFRSAKHMIKDAFKDFRHGLRDSFRDIGFDGGMANKIAKNVMHATRDALRSGVDFSAKLMVAAISQTTSTSAAGTTSSFSMVARSIEVNINHTTGSIDVSTMNVSIEGQSSGSLDGTQPHLLDIQDSDQGRSPDLTGILLALQNLSGIFDGVEETIPEVVDEPALAPAIVATEREAVNNQLAEETDIAGTEETTTRTAVAAVLQTAAGDDVAPTDETTEVAEEVAEEAAEEAPTLPEIVTPLLLNRPEYSARIFITAFQNSINDHEERTTFIRFDATVSLAHTPPPAPAVTLPPIPVADSPEIDPVTDPVEEESPTTAAA